MRALFFIFLSIQLSACLKISDLPNQEEEPNGIQAVSLELPKIETLEAPNAYQVHLPFPSQALIAQRYLKENSAILEMIPMSLKNGILTDSDVQAGAVYVYQFGVIESGSFKELKSYEVSVPKDLLIQAEMILEVDAHWTEFNRIFFVGNGKITTAGHQLVIEADEIISERGVIQTFPVGSQKADADGKAGGNIRILARAGKGLLKIELRGQNGSDGAKGSLHPGSVANCPNEIVQPFGVRFPIGQKGLPGQNGFNGGNSGNAEIQIHEDHTLEIQFLMEAGQAGQGGPGGDGDCRAPGLQFPGPQGATGNPGIAGNKEKICIQDLKARNCYQ